MIDQQSKRKTLASENIVTEMEEKISLLKKHTIYTLSKA